VEITVRIEIGDRIIRPVERELQREASRGLIATIQADYDEMPGLALTAAQGRRLWHVDTVECAHALEALVRAGVLVQTSSGCYVRADAIAP
jgi:hypothetical protein